MDALGASYTTGSFQGTMSLVLANGTSTTLTSAGANDIFVLKLDTSGNTVWARSFGSPSGDGGSGIAVTASGASYVTRAGMERHLALSNNASTACFRFLLPRPRMIQVESFIRSIDSLNFSIDQSINSTRFDLIRLDSIAGRKLWGCGSLAAAAAAATAGRRAPPAVAG